MKMCIVRLFVQAMPVKVLKVAGLQLLHPRVQEPTNEFNRWALYVFLCVYLCVYLCALCVYFGVLCVLLIVISQAAVHGLQLDLQSSCSLLERVHILRSVGLKNLLPCNVPVPCEGGPRMSMPFGVPCNRIAIIGKGGCGGCGGYP